MGAGAWTGEPGRRVSGGRISREQLGREVEPSGAHPVVPAVTAAVPPALLALSVDARAPGRLVAVGRGRRVLARADASAGAAVERVRAHRDAPVSAQRVPGIADEPALARGAGGARMSGRGAGTHRNAAEHVRLRIGDRAPLRIAGCRVRDLASAQGEARHEECPAEIDAHSLTAFGSAAVRDGPLPAPDCGRRPDGAKRIGRREGKQNTAGSRPCARPQRRERSHSTSEIAAESRIDVTSGK